jgi:transcriptional regulator with XRE-family HTH domain
VKEKDTLDALLVRIGDKVTDLRKKKGYSSYESFAYDHDIPRMQYWRVENGKTNLTLKTLHTVLAIHELTIEDFFAQMQKETKKSKT